MEQDRTKRGLSGGALKLIALSAMTLAHITCVVFPGYQTAWYLLALHLIGRIAAPTFWFMAAEGCAHTKSFRRYAARLLALAAVSHFAYNFCFGIPFVPFRTTVLNQTSVIWALFWGVVAVAVARSRLKKWQQFAVVLLCALFAFPADWSSPAAVSVLYIYRNRGNFRRQAAWMMAWVAPYALVYALCISRAYGILQLGVALSLPLLARYDGTRGRLPGGRWLFYVWYPLHLALLGLLRLHLHGNIAVIVGG